jgi:hypothetical protein
MTAADSLGVGDLLRAEIADSVPAVFERLQANIPRLPADSGRWIGEMEEIAETFAAAGVTPGFHEGAAEMFRLLASTPFADESPEEIDRSRTLKETIEAAAELLPERAGAAD